MSTSKCSYCGRGGLGTSAIDTLLGAYHNDDYYDDYRYEWWEKMAAVGHVYDVDGLGEVTLVERNHENPDSYDSVDAHLIFQVDGQLYKKSGTASSYTTEWDGVFKETHVATKEVTYYA